MYGLLRNMPMYYKLLVLSAEWEVPGPILPDTKLPIFNLTTSTTVTWPDFFVLNFDIVTFGTKY